MRIASDWTARPSDHRKPARPRAAFAIGAALALACLSAVGTEARGDVVYVIGSGNEFGTFDVATQSFNLIATESANISGIAAVGGTIYGVAGFDNSELYSIDPKSGALNDLGTLSNDPGIFTVAAVNGTLYGTEGSDLYTIDPSTLTTTHVGSLGLAMQTSGGLGVAGNSLYVTDTNTATDTLNVVDQNTGAASALPNPTGYNFIYGLAFTGGTLYAFDQEGDFLTINQSTGVASPFGSGTYDLGNGDFALGATVLTAAVPEPSSLALVAVGVTVFLGCHARRRRSAAPL